TLTVTDRGTITLPAKLRKEMGIEAGCDILMTGDTRHFSALFGRSVGGLSIRSPVDTAKHILGHH
ncbi:MAG: AbrB/MazE/SpoVT family DNA-binding domain-containing protein, partial [bacterium]